MRIVVKIGTNAITDEKGINHNVVKSVAFQVSRLKSEGHDVILVSSGAIGLGMKELGLKKPVRQLAKKQAAAATGQSILIEKYRGAFSKYGVKVAQILLTGDVFNNRKRFLALRASMNEMLKLGIVPIVNENDAISTDEIDRSFTDNDSLATLVAAKSEAEALIMLTDTDGLYTRDPKRRGAKLLRQIRRITPDIERVAGKARQGGRGGMKSKVEAAKRCVENGIRVVIARATLKDAILKAAKGETVGTEFIPEKKIPSKKKWLRLAKPKGKIEIDRGAYDALKKGRTLLPAGITKVEGSFSIGDVVEIVCNGKSIGRSLSDYSSEELERVKGKSSRDIKQVLGTRHVNVFRRENYVML